MITYFIKRIGQFVPTAFGVVTLVFFLVHLVPGDPVEVMLGETAQPADKEALRHSLGLDLPLHVQYIRFLKGLAALDLGDSFFYKKPVISLIYERLGATAELAAAAMLLAVIIAFPLGIASAIKRATAVDRGAMVAALLGVSIPNFWLGPMLIYIFSIKLDWFPVSGRGGLLHLVLPAITLGTALAGILSRMIRASVLEVLREDFILFAKARNIPKHRFVIHYLLRPALIPVITLIALQLGALLSGAVITETVFSWPGLGTLFLSAIFSRDFPLIQGCVLFFAFFYLAANLLADILYAVVDPRVRLKGES